MIVPASCVNNIAPESRFVWVYSKEYAGLPASRGGVAVSGEIAVDISVKLRVLPL